MVKALSVVLTLVLASPVASPAHAGAFDPTDLKSVSAVDVAAAALRGTVLKVELAAPLAAERGAREQSRGALKAREAADAVAALPPGVQTLFWLIYCGQELGDDSDDTHHVLHVFFALWGGDSAPEIEAAMREAGLAERARVFADAMAMFGQPYPRASQARYNRLGWATPSKAFNAFDLSLIALGRAFGSRAAFKEAVDRFIASRPDLAAWVDQARSSLTDRDRLVNLVTRMDAFDGSRDRAVFLRWPEPYRSLQILEIGLLELVNGGAEQFFVNMSGDTAPEAVAAYRMIGLPKAADAVATGIGFFPRPYPRDRDARLAAEQAAPSLSDRLDALTEPIREGTSDAMVAYAKREGVLPR